MDDLHVLSGYMYLNKAELWILQKLWRHTDRSVFLEDTET